MLQEVLKQGRLVNFPEALADIWNRSSAPYLVLKLWYDRGRNYLGKRIFKILIL